MFWDMFWDSAITRSCYISFEGCLVVLLRLLTIRMIKG